MSRTTTTKRKEDDATDVKRWQPKYISYENANGNTVTRLTAFGREVAKRELLQILGSVEHCSADSDAFYEAIKQRTALIWNGQAIAMFERIGRHQLHSNLALIMGSGPERLKKMPFSLQEKHLDQPFELLILNEDGSTDKILVALSDLTASQVAQLFDRDTIRGLPAQRAWLESERARLAAMAKPVIKSPYKIVGKRVSFLEPCTLSARELARILSEIE